MFYGYHIDLGSPEDYLTAIKRVKDVKRAFAIGQQQAPNEIYNQTGYAVSEFLSGILPALLQICMVQAGSTALGAVVGGILGAAAGGVGAIPGAAEGAAVGFSLSATVLGWLGLAFLFVAVGSSLVGMAVLLQHAVVRAWQAADHPPDQRSWEVQQAGRDIARAMGMLMLLILQAIVAWLLKKGLDKLPELIAELRQSKLGQGFAEWVEKNAAKLYEDPKLRPKQAQGSTTKAGAGSEAQSPSQLAGRKSNQEAEPFRGSIKYRSATDANTELCDRGLARPDTAPFKEGTTVAERQAAVGERFKMAVSQEQYERIVDTGGRQGIGGWGSPESFSDAAAVRDRLAITPEFKPDISHTIEVEVTQPGMRVLEGTAAPIPPYGGGGQQIFFDVPPALRGNMLKVVPGSASSL